MTSSRSFLPVRGTDAGIGFAHGTLADFLAARFLRRTHPIGLDEALLKEQVLAPTLAFYLDLRERDLEEAGEWLLRDLDRQRVAVGSAELLRSWLRWAPRERIEAMAEPILRRLAASLGDRRLCLSLARALQRQGSSWIRRLLAPELEKLDRAEGQALRELFEGGSRSRVERLRAIAARKQRQKIIEKARRKQRQITTERNPLSRLPWATGRGERLEILAAVAAEGKAGAANALFPLLEYRDGHVVRSSVEVLGVLGDAAAIEHLRPLLRADNDYVRSATAKTLGLLHDSESIPEIEQILENDDNPVCRAASALALGLLGAETAVSSLVRSLDPSYEVRGDARGSAATALGQIGDREAVSSLVRSLDPSYEGNGAVLGAAKMSIEHIRDVESRTIVSAAALARTWENLLREFLALTALPAEPFLEPRLAAALATFEKQYGSSKKMPESECRRHLTGLLRQPCFRILEEGWPAAGDRFDIGIFTATGRAAVLELKLRHADKKPDTPKHLAQLRRYLADLQDRGMGKVEGHLIYFDERPDPDDWTRCRAEGDLRVWWVSLNRPSASRLKGSNP